jgi:hypothetical protein
MIEVWEKLDCESIGAAEIEAIEEAVSARFGASAVESPMQIARLLADEGAALRHSEIMELWVKRFTDRPHEAEFRNLLKMDDLVSARRSISRIENLRLKFESSGDKEGLRLLREEVIETKSQIQKQAADPKADKSSRESACEMSEWLTIWLQSPEVFETWIKLRTVSADFKAKFDSGNNKK